MNGFEDFLSDSLKNLEEGNLLRRLKSVESSIGRSIQLEGRQVLNFASNDYLGLANHPALREAASRATEQFGAGSGASRLISGSLTPHIQLETKLASFKQTDAALSFATGYMAAVGAISALVGAGDIVIMDKLVHASIIDAVRLSGALFRTFRHNDVQSLERHLEWAKTQKKVAAPRVLIITESIFSMDGDVAPLREIVALKEKQGAWLMVDEAHAVGLFGARRMGVAEAEGVSEQIEVQMGTLGKSVGASGGYIAGSRLLIEYLVNSSRSFIFSTAPVPAAAAAASAGIELIMGQEGAERAERLRRNIQLAKDALGALGWDLSTTAGAILPLLVGDEKRVLNMAEALLQAGVYVPAVRFPSVARGKARLRLTISATHTEEDIRTLTRVLPRI